MNRTILKLEKNNVAKRSKYIFSFNLWQPKCKEYRQRKERKERRKVNKEREEREENGEREHTE